MGVWETGGVAPCILTLALIEASGQLLTLAALPLGKELPVPVVSEVEWAL